MKTLKDVYIKVTKQNQGQLKCILTTNTIIVGDVIIFLEDSVSSWDYETIIEDRVRVSLSQLKRLIDTIPTREEITRLKRQISAYKTNYDKVVKHSLSKEDVIEELQSDNERLKQMNNDLYDSVDIFLKDINHLEKKLDIQADLIRDKNAQIEQLKQRKWWQIWK